MYHPDYNNELTQFLPRTIVLKKPPGAQVRPRLTPVSLPGAAVRPQRPSRQEAAGAEAGGAAGCR